MIKVVLIERNLSERILIQSRIPDFCTVVTVPDLHSASGLLKNNEIDIVLIGSSTASCDRFSDAVAGKTGFEIIFLTRKNSDNDQIAESKIPEKTMIIPDQLNELPDVFREIAGRKLREITSHPAYSLNRRMDSLIGSSEKIMSVKELIVKFSSAPGPVIITGESGTGKDITARLIHDLSERSAGPFLAVNAGAIPSGLSASEFFGSSAGAFTGAGNRSGFFESADGGTLFLDEITEVDPQVQVELLRVLETGRVRRIGANLDRKVDVRVLAATNRDIAEEVSKGRFRQDLLFRIDMFRIHIPPLRERKEDIPDLLMHFSRQLQKERPKKVYEFSDSFVDKLFDHSWPGNVRELRNVFRRAVYLSDTEILTAESILFDH